MEGLSAEDRALAFRLALGAVAARSFLDTSLDTFLSRPGSIEPRVRDALIISAFELCYLDTPAAIAANEGVELVRSVVPRAAGLANAVLRRVSSELAPRVRDARARCTSFLQDASAQPPSAEDISLAAALPPELAEELFAGMDGHAAAALALAQLEAPPVWVAANGARHSTDELAALLEERGFDAEPAQPEGALRLASGEALAASGLVDGVDLVVCDAAAQGVCHIVAALEGERLLEIGQGRATKSILLASLIAESGRTPDILAVDSVPSKVETARKRIARAGWEGRIECVCADGRKLSEALQGEADAAFDIVFIDAPCSGTGTMRRHPEIASRLDGDALSELTELQLGLLRSSATRVADEGYLVYSTCSVLPRECEELVDAFLAVPEGGDFRVLSCADLSGLSEADRAFTAASTDERGFFRTYPAKDSFDGHFCAVLGRGC